LPAVKREHEGEDDKVRKREDDVQRGAHEEILDPPVIADALHNVASRAVVEERQRQAQQLAQKMAIIATAHTRADV
jgi:hypothetical protein